MTWALITSFWLSAGAVLMSYVGYPAILWGLARVRPRPHRPDEGHLPSVSMVVCAYNEAPVIASKLENALALDYPADRLDIMVLSDCSDDGTDDIVRGFAERGVRLFRQEPRGGKSRALTRFVPEARGEVLVFSDANSLYRPDAIKRLVPHFADRSVGYAVGLQAYAERGALDAPAKAEGLYWRYETAIKRLESRVGSVVGGDGAIYAVRRELFQPLREDDISDFVNPLQVIAAGFRGVYAPEAVCTEEAAPDFRAEFRRKVRIVNRSLRGLLRVRQVLNPLRTGLFAFQVLFHKLVRWLVPFALVVSFGTSLWLSPTSGIYRAALAAHLVVFGLALVRPLPLIGSLRLVYVAYYFVLVNLAAAIGVITYLRGARFVTWTPEREGDADTSPG